MYFDDGQARDLFHPAKLNGKTLLELYGAMDPSELGIHPHDTPEWPIRWKQFLFAACQCRGRNASPLVAKRFRSACSALEGYMGTKRGPLTGPILVFACATCKLLATGQERLPGWRCSGIRQCLDAS